MVAKEIGISKMFAMTEFQKYALFEHDTSANWVNCPKNNRKWDSSFLKAFNIKAFRIFSKNSSNIVNGTVMLLRATGQITPLRLEGHIWPTRSEPLNAHGRYQFNLDAIRKHRKLRKLRQPKEF